MKDIVYVHIDMINNSVLSKGISAMDFHRSIKHTPNNLLLLSNTDEGEYESHTGFRIIRHNQVIKFLETHARRQEEGLKWIDFSDLELVKQLTPVEISELLYFGHMNTHLHSPFFYKLQNNYVFLNVNEQVNKIYYRYIDVFYQVLAAKLKQLMVKYLVSIQRGFFKKEVIINSIDIELIKKMRSFLQEGVVFYFPDMKKRDHTYVIPIYIVEDKLRKVEDTIYTKDMLVANLNYSKKYDEWQLELIK